MVRLWRSTLRQQMSQIDSSEIAACDRLEVHHPDAQIWIVRIGSRHVRRSGVLTYKISSQSLLKVLQAAKAQNHA